MSPSLCFHWFYMVQLVSVATSYQLLEESDDSGGWWL